MEAETHDRQPVHPLGCGLLVLLREARRVLARRIRQTHDVRAVLDREPEPAREVRVEDVEAARAEAELDRLAVDEHDVADLDVPREPRVGDAGRSVHLEPEEPVEALPDHGHVAPAEPDGH